MKKLFCIYFFLLSVVAFSQKGLNNYEYVIVSDKFNFLKRADQYQTSSLTKFLLKKEGFKAYLSSDEMPEEMNQNRCDILYVEIQDASSFLRIKNYVEFKDCNNKVIYKSIKGVSRLKDYKKGYHESIRGAFKDPKIMNYTYASIEGMQKQTVKTATKSTPSIPKVIETKKSPVAKTSTSKTIVSSSIKNAIVLYAQPKENGFQLIDTTPKVVYTLLKTNTPNLYIIKNMNGVLYLKDSKWIAEYYKNNQLIKEELQIKF